MEKPISVYDYLDFRAYLADFYVAKKDAGRGFSYRVFSRRAGLRSPNHLKLVIDGERALSAASALRYVKALALNEEEAAYFLDLVSFNQAQTTAERIDAYQSLTGHHGYRQAHKLDASYAAYYARWYIPAIREMAMQSDFVADPIWIASRMIPAITVEQATEALDVLLELKLLARMDDGSLSVTDWIVQAPDETVGVHLARYHVAMLEKAAESIHILPASQRHISALTLCLSKGSYGKVVERLQRLRQELISLASLEDDGEQVLHIGLQVFPLTRTSEDAA